MLNKIIEDWGIEDSWTLFLDRDGVINYERPNEYITKVANFKFIEGAKEAIALLSSVFGRIIVVTNQQGIGKGLMTENDFTEITNYMNSEIESAGGKILKVYHSPFLSELNHEMQKPRTGMGIKAKQDFPEIDFKKSVMIGNSERDMAFGKDLSMKLIYVGFNHDYADLTIFKLSELQK
jgi:histidinol-phosphate phosphatase family protein